MDQAQLERILDWLVHNFVQVFLIFSIFIQITPIKWNPISSLIKWIGKNLTHDINNKIDDIADQVSDLQDNVDAKRIHVGMEINILRMNLDISQTYMISTKRY